MEGNVCERADNVKVKCDLGRCHGMLCKLCKLEDNFISLQVDVGRNVPGVLRGWSLI